jgi:hypothetical protein
VDKGVSGKTKENQNHQSYSRSISFIQLLSLFGQPVGNRFSSILSALSERTVQEKSDKDLKHHWMVAFEYRK